MKPVKPSSNPVAASKAGIKPNSGNKPEIKAKPKKPTATTQSKPKKEVGEGKAISENYRHEDFKSVIPKHGFYGVVYMTKVLHNVSDSPVFSQQAREEFSFLLLDWVDSNRDQLEAGGLGNPSTLLTSCAAYMSCHMPGAKFAGPTG